MTFAATVLSRIGIWQVSDYQLFRNGKPLSEPSIKQFLLECSDGKALINYAGIGASPELQIHVSDWLRKLLRGQKLTVDGAVRVIAQAANDRLAGFNAYHSFMTGASVKGEPVFYAITNQSFDLKTRTFRRTPHFYVMSNRLHQEPKSVAISMEGTGSWVLQTDHPDQFPNGRFVTMDDKVNDFLNMIQIRWRKPLLYLDVMDHLAELNRIASVRLNTRPQYAAYRGSVSSECLTVFLDPRDLSVKWRSHGLAHPIWMPTVAAGIDVTQLGKTVIPEVQQYLIRCLEQRKGGLPMPGMGVDKLSKLLSSQDWRTVDDFR